MRRIIVIGSIAWLASLEVLAQPVINNVTPVATYAGNKVIITGSGFGTAPKVTFDHVSAAVTSSTDIAIEVNLPPQARLSNVEVLNVVTGLSVKSPKKVVPTFGGSDFDASKIAAGPSFTSAPNEVFDVCSCDMNADGKPDLAGSRIGAALDIMLLQNTSIPGSISFTSSALPVNAQTSNLACGDLNGDGKPDLIAARGVSTQREIFYLRNTSTAGGSIAFAPFVITDKLLMDVGHNSFRVAIRDINMDGKPEVIASNSAANVVYVFVNQSTVGGAISFAATPVKITVTGATTTYGLDVQDLDGDKKPEIVVNQFNAADIYILRNTSSNVVSFDAPTKITRSGTLSHLTTADFNEDGKLDIAVTNGIGNSVYVYINQSTLGSVLFGGEMALSGVLGPWGVDATDADGDGDIDMLIGNRGSGATSLTLMKSNGNNSALAFTPVTIPAGKKSRNIRVVDFDGDAKPDFAFTTDDGLSLDIIRNQNCFIPSLLNSSPLTICAGQTITLNAIAGFGITSYDWKKDGGSVSVGPSASYTINSLAQVGTYTVVANSESGSCATTSTNSVVVTTGLGTVPADPVISSNTPLCNTPGQNLQLSGPTVAGVTYLWTGPNGFTSSLEDPTIANVTSVHAGDYSLRLQNGTCFSNTSTTRVDIVDLANFPVTSSVPSNTVCQGANLTLSVASQSGYSYLWLKDAVSTGQATTSLNVTQEGAYTVRVTFTAIGCSLVTSPAVNVVMLTPPVAAFTVNPSGCVDEVLTFTDQSTKDSRATIVHSWDFNDTGTSSSPSPTHAYTTANNFSPTLTVSYSGVTGCTNVLLKPIVITAIPTVTISPASASLAPGESVQLTASGATTYVWSPTDGLSSSTIENPIASPAATTTYTVTGTTGGCDGVATIAVDVSSASLGDVPNVFTPNGDGANDQWIIQPPDGTCTVSVFDAAGRRLLELQGSTITWDGTYGGSPAPAGTYFYVMSCPAGSATTGNFLLAR